MKLLLDTHAVLWWQTDDRRLSAAARRGIATADIVWVSAASGWEVAIKAALGRLRFEEPFAVTVAADDFTELRSPTRLAFRSCRRCMPTRSIGCSWRRRSSRAPRSSRATRRSAPTACRCCGSAGVARARATPSP